MKNKLSSIALILTASQVAYSQNLLINPGLETAPTGSAVQSWVGNTINTYVSNDIAGWETTSIDNRIEIWDDGALSVPAYEGNQFAEINANFTGALYQDVTLSAGLDVDFLFAHRGRSGVDETRFYVLYFGADGIQGTGDDDLVVNFVGAADNDAWELHYGNDAFVSQAGTYRFAFQAESTANGDNSTGNFLDAFAFGEGVADHLPVSNPEPTSGMLAALASTSLLFRRKR